LILKLTPKGRVRVALFGKKATGDAGAGDVAGAGAAAADLAFVPDPAKARKWFNHARTAADSANYEYALFLYANGIKFDPEDMEAHRGMYESAIRHGSKNGRAASGKELKALDGPTLVDRFAMAEFAWMREVKNPSLAIKLIEAAAKAEQKEFGRWIAPKILNLLLAQKKPSKGQYVAAFKAFGEVGAYEQSIVAGERAVQLDPTDGTLQQEIKNMSAQRAMDQGGYEQAGQEGGFRKFVRDEEKQRDIEALESLSGAGSTEERLFAAAKSQYEANPGNPDAIHRYAQIVKKAGTPEAEEQAYRIYMKGYQDTKEFRFRMAASDIRMQQGERNLRELERQSALDPENEGLREQAEEAHRNLLMYKSAEFAEREERYPTDRTIRFQRGEVEFDLGNYDAAMAAFQQAKDEPKLRVKAGHRLGQSFAAEGWHTDAVAEYREALQSIDVTNREHELPVRYDLMLSLIAEARKQRSIDLAKEAHEICSTIARKDITYRDIRERRREVDQLVQDLSG
jgi:tetratricopeptide (TPR) repeat protein